MRALVEFIEQYRPGFSSEITPADEIDIQLLESLAGSRPLPGVYLRFLNTMGQSMGELELAEAHFGVEGNIATYNAMPWLRREQYICVAGDEGLSDWDYFLDRARPHGADDCMLVRIPLVESYPPERNHPKHVGLEEFLYFEAFSALRMPLLAHRLKFEVSEREPRRPACNANAVCALAEKNGFKRISPVEHCALYERGDAALLLYKNPVEPLYSFTLGCEDPNELGRLAHAFETLTGMHGR